MKKILKQLLYKLPKATINSFYKIYDYLLYPKNRKKMVRFRNRNTNEIIYIIRPRDNTVEGLMSLILNVIRQLEYVDKNGYVPYFDFRDLKTQYSNNDENVWDYYFEQMPLALEKMSDSKAIIYGGLSITRTTLFDPDNWTNEEQIEESRRLFEKYILLNSKTKTYINEEMININTNKTIGLYLRGTDYTKLKPIGHPKQPDLDNAFSKVNEYIEKYSLSKVFLVTEDYDVYVKALNYFGDRLIIASFDSFIKNYDGKEYLSNSESINDISNDKYIRGLNYLTKIVILSKLDYLVAGNTCGSWAAVSFSEGFKDYFIYSLGNY